MSGNPIPSEVRSRLPQSPWPPGLAVLAILAMLSGGAVLATAVSQPLAGADAPAGGRTGVVWLLVFQVALIIQTLVLAPAFGGRRRTLLALVPVPGGVRTLAAAVVALLVWSVVYAAIVVVLDRAALARDLAVAARLMRSDDWGLALLAIGIGAPLAEELVFRGFLLPALARSRFGLAGAAVAVSAGWVALHAGYSLFGLAEVFLIGLFFAWLVVRTGSLWVPIACHAIYNTLLALGLRWLPIPV